MKGYVYQSFVIKLFLLLLLIFSSSQARAALGYTHLDSGSGTVSTTTVNTNSISVAANELVVIAFAGYSQPTTITSVVYNGTSTSLTNIATQTFVLTSLPSHDSIVSAYYFIPTGASSGTITITFGQSTLDYDWSTFYFSGENTSTPIVQNTASGISSCSPSSNHCTSLTESLGSPIASNDATVAIFSADLAITATTGYATIDNISSGSSHQLSEYEITGTQSPNATWGSTEAGGLAFEVGVGSTLHQDVIQGKSVINGASTIN